MLIITFFQQEFVLLPELQNIDIIGEDEKVQLLSSFQKTRWLAFVFPPLILVLRLLLVSTCLFIGGFFSQEMSGYQYSRWWNIAISAQFVMLGYSCLLCIVNLCAGQNKTFEITSCISLMYFTHEDTEKWIKLPLSAVNLFEITYWIAMSFFVSKLSGAKLWKSFKFVMSSYGVGYLFYIALLMFLLLYLE